MILIAKLTYAFESEFSYLLIEIYVIRRYTNGTHVRKTSVRLLLLYAYTFRILNLNLCLKKHQVYMMLLIIVSTSRFMYMT